MAMQTPVDRARAVLEGVPRARFYDGTRCPEDFPFSGALRACLEYLGEASGCPHAPTCVEGAQPACPYAYINGASGLAWRLLWNAEEWDYGNGNILAIAADPGEPFRRAFEAVGYAHEIFLKDGLAASIAFQGERCDDEAYYRRRIVESIRDRGRPVIGLGVVGPPECCIITGYDGGGDLLLGWSYFQDMPDFSQGLEFEPSGYFRKRDWFQDTMGLIVIGEKQEPPPLEVVYRRALEWALEVVRTPSVRQYQSGLAAYTAWAEALLRDEEFAIGDMDLLRRQYAVHYDAVGYVAEGRWYGAQLLKEIAAHLPAMREALEAAASCYEDEHDLMWAVWEFAGGNGFTDEHVKKLAQPGVRQRIAPLIRISRRLDAEAAGHIEWALTSRG
jgi:hypothetical protein